ncbi:MAG TPA: RNA polymerase sigma factor [Puia sp.]|nr:RNA polymerase sigma factor [Puia sp.]
MVFNDEDTALISQFLKGNKAAFIKVYRNLFPLLFEYGIRFTHDRSLIKDTLQDFFMNLLNRKSPLPDIYNIRSYFMVSVRRELLRRMAREARVPVGVMNGDSYEFHLELSPESALIDRQSGEQRSRGMQQAINCLSARQREAIYLYFYNNLTYEEVAEVMGLKEVKYARTLIYRALGELKLVLREDASILLKIIS